VRIRELVLPSADPATAAAFHPQSYGSTRLRFEPGPPVCSHFAVNVGDFGAAVEWARERADLIADDVPFGAWRARAAYFYDGDGNIVELIARERAPGAQLMLEVSEVGLPVADVPAAVDFLRAELELPVFDDGGDKFHALGDDHGLFIVVPVGRNWLFSDRPASDAPVRVTIEGESARSLEVPGSEHVIEVASN
jgi:catechol 2,3-dioxygenase-like lactoylglutathione lyase family enzyme